MRLINIDALNKPIYAEEDNITGSNMSYDEMMGYNDGIDETWAEIMRAPIIDTKLERKREWISGDVKPTKVGEKAICLTKWGNIVLGEVISYRGELIWEEYNLFGGTFTPVYWMKIPELPKM